MNDNQETKSPEEIKENLRSLLEKFLGNIEQAIQQESDTTNNDWLSCFATRVTVLPGIFSPQNIGRDKFFEIAEKIRGGKFGSAKISELKDTYPNDPPDEIKKALIEDLKTYAFEILEENL